MRFWITFGVGLVLGTVAGAFLAVFILFDDLIERTPHSAPIVASAHPEGERPLNLSSGERPPSIQANPVSLETLPSNGNSKTASSTRESKPPAIAAEAVDFDLLYPTEASRIIVNAKREDSPPSRAQ